MARSPTFRLFLAAAVFVGVMVLLAVVLSAAQFGLSLWQQLQSAPVWVVVLIATVASLMLGFGGLADLVDCATCPKNRDSESCGTLD